MSVNNFDFERLFSELDNELANAHEELASEIRLDNEEEILDAVKYSQRESKWIERLTTGSVVHIRVGTNRINGTIQHACDEAIVLVNEKAICLIPTNSVSVIEILPEKISPRSHVEHRCWRAVLGQIHDVKVFISNDFHSGTVAAINRDAFDFVQTSRTVTIPWRQVSFIEVFL